MESIEWGCGRDVAGMPASAPRRKHEVHETIQSMSERCVSSRSPKRSSNAMIQPAVVHGKGHPINGTLYAKYPG